MISRIIDRILVAIIYGIGFYFLYKDKKEDEKWSDDDHEEFLATMEQFTQKQGRFMRIICSAFFLGLVFALVLHLLEGQIKVCPNYF